MKNLFALLMIIALATFCSCEKQQTEEERNAEIERQVQQRVAAERQTQAEQQLAQRQSELDAREKALSEKENAPANTRKPESRSTTRTEERTTRVEERRPTGSYDTFYTKLDRYGDWRETSDYGFVFQPREAQQSRSWRPYTDGRWVYTDVGWTWISEEPFGWATYHYGRWTRLRNIGWVWVPGDEWAPAWVSWRKSDEYVGWAPLPPEARFDRRTGIHNWSDNYYDIGPDQYSFVETRQFGAPRARRAVVPVERNVTIINQTTNVTNITYNNTTVINQGPNYDELRTRTQQPIERLRLERQVNVDVNVAAPQPVVRGEMVVIPAPLIARGQAVERPRTVKETIAHVEVERGWDDIADKQAAEKARAKMKSEATPPPNAPSKTFVKPTEMRGEASAAPVTSTSPAATSAPIASPSVTVAATPFHRLTTDTTPVPTTTPTATATASPSATATSTPVRRLTPLTSPTATAAPSATAAATATATPAATAITTPTVAASAAETTPAPLATNTPATRSTPVTLIQPRPSASPGLSPESPNPKAEEQRRFHEALKSKSPELQRRIQPPTPRGKMPMGSPSPSAASSPTDSSPVAKPSPAVSASVAPNEPTDAGAPPSSDKAVRKQERKERKRGAEPVPGESKVSPSPTPTPAIE